MAMPIAYNPISLGQVQTVFAVDSKGRVTSVTNTSISFGAATVASADKLTNGRTIAITGDLAYTSPSFDGTANITATSTLASTGVTASTYGSGSQVPVLIHFN